ncbi:EAL domain-containing protein [Roseomonas sp. 18066]|uniref:sensor domain-containing protein n=1 Tax=Roseomonas sp. 18066 TaxID=2681412 RepID=UPI0013598A18|nr:EAL domain-containing protein [Roseomonas sp. 18066]
MSGIRELRLTSREGFLLSILEGTTDCIKVLDLRGRLLFINSPGLQLFETSAASDVIGSDWTAFWPDQLRGAAQGAIRAAAKGKPTRFVGAGRTFRGTLKWWDNALAPVFGDSGTVEYIVCISRDVSERHAAEDKLQVTQTFLDQVLEHVPVGVFVKSVATGVYERVNRTAEQIFGRGRDGWVGRSDADLFPEEQARFFRLCDQETAESGKTMVIEEEPLDTPHLGRRLLRTKKVPLQAGDRPATHIVGVTEDMTESRRTEKALRDSEARLARAVAAARMGVWDWNVETGEFNASNGLELIYGLAPGSLRTRADVHASVHPDDLAAVGEAMERCLGGENGGSFASEFRTSPANGPLRWLRVTGQAELDCNGRAFRISGVTHEITERREAEARIAYMAHHDSLTGLLNRGAWQERLVEAARHSQQGEPCAILHLDLDLFKEVNDTFGHPAGDDVLRSVATRLMSCMREADTVARLGGDEFVILRRGEDSSRETADFAARIIDELGRPFLIEGRPVTIGVSIGVVLAPRDGDQSDQLMRRVDLALYAAKGDGGRRFRFFDPEMQACAQARRHLEADLQRALRNGEFELHYQPLVDLAHRRISGFEALLRWRSPERGLVRPDAFIPVAEATGLIVPLGKWILEQACADAATWPSGLKVAVNLSAAQVCDGGFEASIAEALAAAGLAPERLELEITESLLLRETEDTVAMLRRLRTAGLSISMDDFGTGYSSLSYLLKFPISKVKIDRSFVLAMDERPEGAAIIGAIAGLCRTLGIATTAEGIETTAQLQQVASQGCTEGQGYLFSPPRPAVEALNLLATWDARLST